MTITICLGDCREALQTLPAESVHCVVTSPPYFGLRDYGTATWEGGDPACSHRPFNGYPSGVGGTTEAQDNGKLFKDKCELCGATRIDSQLGLETSPEAYVAELVAVFREVRRVLRGDGIAWVNLGDSYRAKQLLGIPWRVAFALQADGFYLRQDIIWSKPNPMPESVRDRCTKAHEYLFLLSKNERYHYDAEAIAEAAAVPEGAGNASGNRYIAAAATDPRMRTKAGLAEIGPRDTRNKRSVWEIASQPFPEAHFATFSPALIEPCILAGCPKGGTVLDPFGGAGTTGLVADRLGRNAILIELNSDYTAMAERRIRNDAGMFASIIHRHTRLAPEAAAGQETMSCRRTTPNRHGGGLGRA